MVHGSLVTAFVCDDSGLALLEVFIPCWGQSKIALRALSPDASCFLLDIFFRRPTVAVSFICTHTGSKGVRLKLSTGTLKS